LDDGTSHDGMEPMTTMTNVLNVRG